MEHPGDILVLWPIESPGLQCGLSQRTWDLVVPFMSSFWVYTTQQHSNGTWTNLVVDAIFFLKELNC